MTISEVLDDMMERWFVQHDEELQRKFSVNFDNIKRTVGYNTTQLTEGEVGLIRELTFAYANAIRLGCFPKQEMGRFHHLQYLMSVCSLVKR